MQNQIENERFPLLELIIEDYKEVQEGKYTKFIHPFVTYWYYQDKLHRENGPAIEWSDGNQSWYKNGILHREDGPANISSIHGTRWYIEGVQYTEEEFSQYLQNKTLRNKLQQHLEDKNIVQKVKL